MTKSTRILLVEDREALQSKYVQYFREHGFEPISARTIRSAKAIVLTQSIDCVIMETRTPNDMVIQWIAELIEARPSIMILVITDTSDTPFTVKAIKMGAENVMIQPVDISTLASIIAKFSDSSAPEASVPPARAGKQAPFFGDHVSTVETINLAKIASTSSNIVLLLGETGTGKGILAKWIHEHSDRASSPFVEVNCSSLKGELLRSELFGHARGAFTSAVKDKEGLLEVANMGTLFLDEIGDMNAEVQVQLLKTIEDRTFRRVGENTIRHSNFRLICATNRDLLASGPNGFRQDLYYRICVFPIQLKGLRDKKEEILALCEHILAGVGYAHLPLCPELRQKLQAHPWPGNVRELRNMLERALMLAQGVSLALQHFPGLSEGAVPSPIPMGSLKLDDIEDIHILQVVTDMHGNIQQASKALGLSVSSLYRRLGKIRDTASITEPSCS